MQLVKKSEKIKNDILTGSVKEINTCFETHKHDFFEIEYIIKGSGEYIIDGKTYRIKPGMLFFMTQANFHSVRTKGAELINVMFSGSLGNNDSLFQLVAHNSSPAYFFDGEDAALVSSMLKELVHVQSENNLVYAVQLLNCVLYKLVSMGERDLHIKPYVRETILYILENFTQNITLDTAANHVGLSKTYLSELFLKEAEVNFKVYLDNIRFDYAKKLLIFSNMSVKEVCFSSGFRDYANFSRRFKLKFRATPQKYRDISREELQL